MPEPAVGAGGRIDARERALALLYEAEIKDLSATVVLAELPAKPDPFTTQLVAGVSEHLEEIDAELTRFSHNWDLDRMPVLDRTILRLGTYELIWSGEIPTAVAINEAVELAKRFSTDKSSKFVNGVLARLASEHRTT